MKNKYEFGKFEKIGFPHRVGALEVRETTVKDARRLNEIFVDPKVNLYLIIDSTLERVPVSSTVKHIKNSIANPLGNHLVLTLDGIVIGGASIVRFSGRSSHVAEFGVMLDSKYHSQGLGTIFLSKLFEYAKTNGIEKISCMMLSDNKLGHKFYTQKLGMKEQGLFSREVRREAVNKNVKPIYIDAYCFYKFL